MTQPLPLDTVLSEFAADYEAWVLQSAKSGTYLIIPDNRYPGRRPIRFYMSEHDAGRVLAAVLEVNPGLAAQRIKPVRVNLHRAMGGIAADKTPGHADSFVMHSPNEVFDFVREL